MAATQIQVLQLLIDALNEGDVEKYWIKAGNTGFNALYVWVVILRCAPFPDDLASFLLGFLYPANTQHSIDESIENNRLTDDGLVRFNGFAKAMITHLIKPMRNSGRLAADSEKKAHPEKPTTRDKEFKEIIMERDGARCRLTGRYDPKFKTIETWMPVNENPKQATLQGAHIIPYSTGDKEFFHTLLHIFTSGRISRTELVGDRINSVDNGFLLQSDAHNDFDNFRWGLLPVGKGEHGEAMYVAQHILPTEQTLLFPIMSFDLPTEPISFGRAKHQYQSPNQEYLRAHFHIGKMIKDLLDTGLVQVEYGYTDDEDDQPWEELDDLLADL